MADLVEAARGKRRTRGTQRMMHIVRRRLPDAPHTTRHSGGAAMAAPAGGGGETVAGDGETEARAQAQAQAHARAVLAALRSCHPPKRWTVEPRARWLVGSQGSRMPPERQLRPSPCSKSRDKRSQRRTSPPGTGRCASIATPCSVGASGRALDVDEELVLRVSRTARCPAPTSTSALHSAPRRTGQSVAPWRGTDAMRRDARRARCVGARARMQRACALLSSGTRLHSVCPVLQQV